MKRILVLLVAGIVLACLFVAGVAFAILFAVGGCAVSVGKLMRPLARITSTTCWPVVSEQIHE